MSDEFRVYDVAGRRPQRQNNISRNQLLHVGLQFAQESPNIDLYLRVSCRRIPEREVWDGDKLNEG